MYKFLLVAIMVLFTVTPLSAEEKHGYLDLDKDLFLAGTTVVQDAVGVDDLFMFGETVRSKQDTTGSVHRFGRKVVSVRDVGGDAYLAGMDVSLVGKVAGDVTVSGYNVQVGDVGGDLRASGANLTISGVVSGYALVAGDEVRFESIVEGNVNIAAREINFAENARIQGKLTIYEEQAGEVDIPVQVISEDRIERRSVSEWSEAGAELESWNWHSALRGFFTGVLIITAIAALIAATVPGKLADLRRNILGQPFRSLLFGFLALSVALGSTIILMMTGVGLLLVPLTLIMTFLGAFAGYVVGAYALGVGLLLIIKRPEPGNVGARALAAGIGAFFVAIVALIPLLGWLFVMSVTLVGTGAIAIWLFRPKFFAINYR